MFHVCVCGIMKWNISLAEVLEVWVLFGVVVLEEGVVLEETEVRKILALEVYETFHYKLVFGKEALCTPHLHFAREG